VKESNLRPADQESRSGHGHGRRSARRDRYLRTGQRGRTSP